MNRRKYLLVAGGVTFASAVLVLSWWLSSGIKGELFLVSPSGQAEPALGARISVFRGDHKVLASFMLSTQREELWSKYERKLERLAEAAGNPKVEQGSLRQYLKIAELTYCSDLNSLIGSHFGRLVETTTTDRRGLFSVRLRPGSYVLWASGQAGNAKAEWLEVVTIRWREQVRVVEPICRYEVE